MKKLLLILCLGCTVTLSNAQAQNAPQSLQDGQHKLLGYVKGGQFTDANNNYMGEFKASSTGVMVLDRNHNVLGYMQQGKVFLDADHKTLGSLSGVNGNAVMTVIDGSNKVLGYLNMESGEVQDSQHKIIGYEVSTEPMWAAPYFFFYKF